MARSKRGKIDWHSPDPRAIIPLEKPQIPKSLKKKLRKGVFSYTINQAFDEVIQKCSERRVTWISDDIIDTYTKINRLGFAASVETWMDNRLVGGLYGATIGAAFFGESMFNTESDAAKAAFYHLIEVMKRNDYILLDSQYINDFTMQLGAVEVPRHLYMKILHNALLQHRDLV